MLLATSHRRLPDLSHDSVEIRIRVPHRAQRQSSSPRRTNLSAWVSWASTTIRGSRSRSCSINPKAEGDLTGVKVTSVFPVECPGLSE